MAPAASEPGGDSGGQEVMVPGGDDGKYRKLFHLFRFTKQTRFHKNKSRKKSETLRGTSFKNGGSTPEERRSQLDRDMRRSWDSLPETLRRRRQRVSRALLSQFVDPAVDANGDADPDGGQLSSGDGAPQFSRNREHGQIQELSRTAFFFDDEDEDEDGPASPGSSTGSHSLPIEIRTKVMLHHSDEEKKDSDREDHAVVLIISDSPTDSHKVETEKRKQGLNLEEMEAVELLARAVSSDSLLLESNASSDSGQSSVPRQTEDDSGTDVNQPSSSASSIEGADVSLSSREAKSSQPDWPNYEIIGETAVYTAVDKSANKSDESDEPTSTPVGSDNAENPYTVMEFENATIVANQSDASTEEVDSLEPFDADETPLPSGRPALVEEPLWAPALSRRRSSVDVSVSRRPVAMETIAEEPSAQDESTRLSVREILQRFEELGGRVPDAATAADALAAAASVVENTENALPDNDDEKSSTLKDIQETLLSLEEKVRNYKTKTVKGGVGGRLESFQPQNNRNNKVVDGWTGRVAGAHHPPAAAASATPPQNASAAAAAAAGAAGTGAHVQPASSQPQSLAPQTNGGSAGAPLASDSSLQYLNESWTQVNDGKHSLLQFAMHHFRQSPEKFEMLKTADGSISGSLEVIESLKSKKNKGKGKSNKENEWTWKEQVELVKFSTRPIEQSLLRLETEEMSELAVECFVCIMRYMGDLPMTTDITEVKCVYTVLMHCHKHEALRDEVYCQLMKQTTNNKSTQPESCQRGWRLFSIVAAYFVCSETLKPYLFKYLETSAYDKRRAYHGTAMVCLQNLRKTFRYGGRKNVPSVEEITAISAGRNSKRQMYRLPGGTERVVNTRSTTVVQDVIDEICGLINVSASPEVDEFSLYCIVEGDTFTMPLAREEYILDVTTELHKNQQVFYLIFCRSVWHFPLRLDSQLYIEVVFNQIAPDYLEGLLLVMPGETLQQDTIYEIAKIAALLHRAADMTHVPAMKETKFLLPKPALTVRDIKPTQWVNMVQSNWVDVQSLDTIQAKAQVLEMLSHWTLFGSSFFAVKRVSDPKERADHILALNRHGVHFIDIVTHETLLHHPFSEVISTRKVKSEDGTLFLDMKCGNLMQQRITRLQTDQAHEISRLIRQYITLQQRMRS